MKAEMVPIPREGGVYESQYPSTAAHLFYHDGYDVQDYVDYLEAAGLVVLAADGTGNTVEAVVAANPDIIVIALTDLATLSRTKPYGSNS